MTREEKIICKVFLDDADKTHSCNEYKLLMELLEQESIMEKYKTMWEKLKGEVESNIAYYEDGFMCSIAESVEGGKMWNKIRTIMNKLEIEEE